MKIKNDKKIWQLPTIFVLFIPLIMWGTVFENHLSGFSWHAGNPASLDVFLIGKRDIIILVGMVNAVAIICYIIKKKIDIKKLKLFIPVGIYVLMVFASTLVSEYRYFGFHGIVEQFESVWVILSYVLCCIYAFLISEELLHSRLFWNLFAGSALLVGLIGTFQTFGIDVLQSDLVKGLYMAAVPDIELSFSAGNGVAYSTLQNPDYVGVYVNLVAPLLTWSFFRCKSVYEKALYATSFALCLISLVGARSTAGILIAGFSILLYLLFTFFGKNKALSICTAILFAGAVCIAFAGLIRIFSERTEPDTKLTAISTDSDAVRITYDGLKLELKIDPDSEEMMVTDEKGKLFELYESEPGYLRFEDPELEQIRLAWVEHGDYLCMDVIIGEHNLLFTDMGDKGYYYVNLLASAEPYCSEDIPTVALIDGHEKLMNGRGYIWSRTIPLLADCIFLGRGQDTFAIYYPNNDYLGKINYGYETAWVTKPHNIYLQIAVQSGIISAIAYVAAYMVFCILFFKNKGVHAFLISATAFMLLGLSNDSMIACSIIFWVIFGLGMGASLQGKIMNSECTVKN